MAASARSGVRVALGAALVLAAATAWIRLDPNVVLLLPEGGASWIRPGIPSDLAPEPRDWRGGTFRTAFEAARDMPSAVLSLRVLGDARAWVDGRRAGPFIDVGRRAWKTAVPVDIGPLAAGLHVLEIDVVDPSGPAALLVSSNDLPVATSESWEVRVGTEPWAVARGLDRPWYLPVATAFPSSGAALLRVLPALLPLFVLVFAACLVREGPARRRLERLVPSPGAARWILLALWTALALNDVRRLPLYVGFDADAHMSYLRTIALQGRLPAPGEGWQTFQAPLYYILSAKLWKALSALRGAPFADYWIRLLSALCGAAQIEAAFRCARSVNPKRPDLQRLTVLVGGLMPMSLYLSLAVGNEPLAGAFGAAAVALALSFRPGPRERRELALLGAALGLGLLAKASTLVLAAPVLVLAGLRLRRRGRAAEVSLAAACAAAVCGWYYGGNLLRDGTPFPDMFASGYAWWQEPGYRTAAQLTRFGAALVHPVYAGVNGLWDSLYSTLWMDGYLSGVADPAKAPPWNYAFMLASGLLALVPTLALAAGLLRLRLKPRDEKEEGLLFSGAVVLLYLGAIAFVWLRLPVYSAGKASYMLAATPCLALLAASGFDVLMKNRAAKAALYAALACWAVAVFAAYFVVAPFVPAG